MTVVLSVTIVLLSLLFLFVYVSFGVVFCGSYVLCIVIHCISLVMQESEQQLHFVGYY